MIMLSLKLIFQGLSYQTILVLRRKQGPTTSLQAYNNIFFSNYCRTYNIENKLKDVKYNYD